MQRYPYTVPGVYPPTSLGWRLTLHLGRHAGHFVALLPNELQGPPDMEQDVDLESDDDDAESVATVEEEPKAEPGTSSSHAEVEVDDRDRVLLAKANLARTTSAKRASATADVDVELTELHRPKGVQALTMPEAAISHVERHRGKGEEHRDCSSLNRRPRM